MGTESIIKFFSLTSVVEKLIIRFVNDAVSTVEYLSFECGGKLVINSEVDDRCHFEGITPKPT
jgi:hypothetical protein